MGLGPLKASALWSMSVVDVMSCGKPVLCPAYAAFPEMLRHNPHLLANSQSDLSEKLNKLLDDPEHYGDMSNYCFEIAKEYSVDNTADKFIEIFESVTR